MNMNRQGAFRVTSRRRGAALYIVVLSVAMIVAVLGLASLGELMSQREASQRLEDTVAARRYAQAAIEVGLQRISADTSWRTTFSSGTWLSNQWIGEGKYSLSGVDTADGVLATPLTDSVVLTGTGTCGDATQKLEVTIVPDAKPLSCLQVMLHVGNDIAVQTGSVITGTTAISANDQIQATGGVTVNPPSQVVTGYVGTIGPGSNTTGITPREMPVVATVFSDYVTNGRAIAISSIPTVSGVKTIEQVVLSAGVNPYGTGLTNTQGIYVIDCGGQNIQIRNCRIVATLVLLNAGSGSQIVNSVCWAPHASNYPALLVQGNMALNFANTALAETTANFNPASTPYNGASDAAIDDSYPSKITGLVYVSQNASTANSPVFEGCLVVGNTLTAGGTIALTYQAAAYNTPPPGFVDYSKVKISTGTWRQRVN